jgi:hypothetical protein
MITDKVNSIQTGTKCDFMSIRARNFKQVPIWYDWYRFGPEGIAIIDAARQGTVKTCCKKRGFL